MGYLAVKLVGKAELQKYFTRSQPENDEQPEMHMPISKRTAENTHRPFVKFDKKSKP